MLRNALDRPMLEQRGPATIAFARVFAESGAPSRYPQSVAVEVFEITLAPGKCVLIDLDAELRGDSVDVVDVEVDEGIGARVTLVFGEVEAHTAARHGNEPGQPRLELMLPLLLESEPVVPGNGSAHVLDIQNGYYLFVHTAEVTAASRLRTPPPHSRTQLPYTARTRLFLQAGSARQSRPTRIVAPIQRT